MSPGGSPAQNGRNLSKNRHSPDNRPLSYVDLLSMPYAQQVAPGANLDNSSLKMAVGSNASLLDHNKTLEMYRANVKKTQDPAVQYEFAVFMVQIAMDLPPEDKGSNSREDMLKEARQILHKLADRGYPFAQYYLGDGFSSGLFSKGKEDYDRAFPLFVAASKHGHAEAGYRAALCYEFGWGCRKDYAKAVQFYRASASKNHPGAATRLGMACLEGTMGLTNHYREGIKWLKRAAESADVQYNAAPYELGRLHENGYGDDIFKDEVYAAQLFTQSADLGHPEANLVMGKAYEHGMLKCPKDAALSIHFYNGAAQAGVPEAMMALCAWYLFGAEPILSKDENEAFEWAKRAADLGMFISSLLYTLTLWTDHVCYRLCQGRVCCWLLQGDWHRLPTRRPGSERVVCPRRTARRRTSEAASCHHPGRRVRRQRHSCLRGSKERRRQIEGQKGTFGQVGHERVKAHTRYMRQHKQGDAEEKISIYHLERCWLTR
jgi:TPR repeat protein